MVPLNLPLVAAEQWKLPSDAIRPKYTLELEGVKEQLKVTVSFASKEKAVLARFIVLGEMLHSSRLVALAE